LECPVWVVLHNWVSTSGVLLAQAEWGLAQAEWVLAWAPGFYLSVKLILFTAGSDNMSFSRISQLWCFSSNHGILVVFILN
jgi:hypothetical protein